ncbi:MAG: universal stress protein [Persicimonas sp.]
MKGSSIILATDLSETAKAAARWTHRFARDRGASVIVSHVIRISVGNWVKGEYDVLDDADLMEKAEARVADWYEDATGGAPDEVEVLVGHASVQLADTVDDHEAEMLVLSVSGKGSWEKLLLGSTARNLANDPPCPMVLVEPDHTELQEPPRIGVGLDFSDNSVRAASYATDLAKTIGAELHFIHVDTEPTIDAIDDEDLPGEFSHQKMFDWADEEMSKVISGLGERLEGVDYETHCIQDKPAKGLVEFARNEDLDLLVVGRSGHSKFTATIMGSVLLKVLQAVPATTIIVPHGYTTP